MVRRARREPRARVLVKRDLSEPRFRSGDLVQHAAPNSAWRGVVIGPPELHPVQGYIYLVADTTGSPLGGSYVHEQKLEPRSAALDRAWDLQNHARTEASADVWDAWQVVADAFETAGKTGVAERLRRETASLRRNLPQRELLHIAVMRANAFFDRRRPTERNFALARTAAFDAILKADRLAATSHHRSVKNSADVARLAHRAVLLARRLNWTPSPPTWASRIGRHAGGRTTARDPAFDRVRALVDHAEAKHEALLQSAAPLAPLTPVAQAYLVAADAAEETGFTAWARDLRGLARKLVVFDWARRKWPWGSGQNASIRLGDIMALLPRQKDVEITRFHVFTPTNRLNGIEVAVDRRGRVRVVRGAL